ncbi:hypothetical protein [Nostoc sp.]|uniref:hypothetical protein n=1 Tax=Nostoc sp. TaxID=1180 RepID=UPI002FF8CE3A
MQSPVGSDCFKSKIIALFVEIYQSDAVHGASRREGGLRLRTCVLDRGATKFEVLLHDFGVPQHDIQVLQHDFGVPQHDIQVLQHDFGVLQHDIQVLQHDFGVPQHGFQILQHVRIASLLGEGLINSKLS